eukprot:10823813-Alexandrium_andersonii.AAC.1
MLCNLAAIRPSGGNRTPTGFQLDIGEYGERERRREDARAQVAERGGARDSACAGGVAGSVPHGGGWHARCGYDGGAGAPEM